MQGLTKRQKALRRKWIAALRSGKFTQCREALEDLRGWPLDGEPTHCCLGVLCRVIKPEGSIEDLKKPWEEYLKSPVWRSVGLAPRDQAKLAKLNDDGVSFEEIAALLEHLPAPE